MLARYFRERNLFLGFDFSSMKAGRPDELFAVWLTLPDHQRAVMEAELLQNHFERAVMRCGKGQRFKSVS